MKLAQPMRRLAIPSLLTAITLLVSAVLFRYASHAPPVPHTAPLQRAHTAAPPTLSRRADASTQRATVFRAAEHPILPDARPSLAPTAAGRARVPPPPALHAAPSAEPDSAPIATAGDTPRAVSLSPAPSARHAAVPRVVLPLVFQDIDLFVSTPQGLRFMPANDRAPTSSRAQSGATAGAPGTLVIDETALPVLDQLRRDFIEAVGGQNQDANDPAYPQRWRQAQTQSDRRFMQQYGAQAFQKYQLAAAQKAHADSQAIPADQTSAAH